jgi:endonuclease YncB( thermonuclease family)
LEVLDTDRYGRSIAYVLIDGKSLNEEPVKAVIRDAKIKDRCKFIGRN